jgi:PhnB protein
MSAPEDELGPTAGLTPHISVEGGKAAIDFYTRAFGAEVVSQMPAEDGERLMHAHLRINGGSLMLHDHFPEYADGAAAPKPAGVTLHLQVENADSAFQRALAAGASVVMPLADQFWGDRYGQVQDPFGHTWSIGALITKS